MCLLFFVALENGEEVAPRRRGRGQTKEKVCARKSPRERRTLLQKDHVSQHIIISNDVYLPIISLDFLFKFVLTFWNCSIPS